MVGLTLPLVEAKHLAKALAPHASRDGFYPLLTNVVVGGEFGAFAYATDRYSVAQYDLTNIITEVPEEPFMIPVKALASLASLGKVTLPGDATYGTYNILFETVTVGKSTFFTASAVWTGLDGVGPMTHWMRSWEVLPSHGKFPAVPKFFTDFIPSPKERAHLSAAQLSKFTGYANQFPGIDNMRVTLGSLSTDLARVMFMVEVGNRFKGVITEQLMTPTMGYGRDIAKENQEKDEAERRLVEAGEAEGQKDVERSDTE